MPVKLERTDEHLTRRTGLILVNRYGDKINLASPINRAFREPSSNRGFEASHYVLTIVEMLIDGATCLEDVRLFEGTYHYWIIATNIPDEEQDAQAIIPFHNKRGEFEKMIGELKHHYGLDLHRI